MRDLWRTWLEEVTSDTGFAVRHTLARLFGERILEGRHYETYEWRGRKYTITKG